MINPIERIFYDAFIENVETPKNLATRLRHQFVVGIYRVDFLVDDIFVIEIDGHEYHKTKEQRESDYVRERYLLKRGFIPIRFMATEVYLDAKKCVKEVFEIVSNFSLNGGVDRAK